MPQNIFARWKALPAEEILVQFYGHKTGDFRCFSNFFQHPEFVFEIPGEFCAAPLEDAKRRIRCTFSEKAIMLCKAAAMGDLASFDAIAESTTPREAKGLGRGIKAFDQALWNRIVLSVAYEVVLQKFTQLEDLRQVLLSTADRTIAEMISEDSIWGTGVDIGSAEAAELPSGPAPTSWAGRSWRRAVP